ncbi:MAG TPA: hypothetical protein VE912_24105 [Bacteroidales bacterium]|nr:hypothetical protein [Bacteroidales bacterium]
MKNLLFLSVLVILLFYSCSTQKDITTVSVSGVNTKLTFTPEYIQQKLSSGLEVYVKPISAEELNAEFGQLSLLSGQYNNQNLNTSHHDYVLTNNEEKQTNNILEKGIEALHDTLLSNQITNDEINNIINKVIDIYGTKEEKEYYIKSVLKNPYFVKNKYLSIFKVELINRTDELVKTGLSNIDVLSGKEELKPYSNKDLKYYQSQYENDLLIDRLNLTEEINIYPRDTVIKYFATPPINVNSKILKLYFNDSVFSFKTDYQVDSIKNKFNYYRLHTTYDMYTILPIYRTNNGEFKELTVDNGDILVPEDILNQKIDIIVFKKYSSYFTFNGFFNLSVSDYLTDNNKLGTIPHPSSIIIK